MTEHSQPSQTITHLSIRLLKPFYDDGHLLLHLSLHSSVEVTMSTLERLLTSKVGYFSNKKHAHTNTHMHAHTYTNTGFFFYFCRTEKSAHLWSV